MTADTVIVHPDADTLAAAVASRLITGILDAQSRRGVAHIALTGGRIGTATLAATLVSDPAYRAVDWGKVDFWWSDERFVPAGDADRNDAAAFRVMLDKLPVDPQRVEDTLRRDKSIVEVQVRIGKRPAMRAEQE